MKRIFLSSSSFSAPAVSLGFALFLLGACSSSEPSGPSGSGGTSGGAGGSTGTGGRTGTGGSTAGSGGSSGSGGASAGGSGGSAAGGRGGAGGSGPGGSGGSGGAGNGGTTGNPDGGTDRPPVVDMSNDLSAERPSDTMNPSGTLDACFAGLRAGRGSVQVGNKASADGKYRTRLALETADRIGTSGTKPWVAFRFGIETPEGVVCVKDEATLAAAYKGSRHNCTDTFDITAEGRRFLITNPEIDPTKPKSKLTIFTGTTMTAGPIELTNGACMSNTGGTCTSGGPC
ncbi:MAG TPA: hypothetical protein VGF45_18730 [Polyangia bacterium]